MDIWTEQLYRRHLPIVEHWLDRSAGALTPNDLPKEANQLSAWFEERAESDFLISVYETPVGVSGFRDNEFYLFLGETGYNFVRTATYATLRMLDHAFMTFDSVYAYVYKNRHEYLSVLNTMGFTQLGEENGLIMVSVQKPEFQSRKHLF